MADVFLEEIKAQMNRFFTSCTDEEFWATLKEVEEKTKDIKNQNFLHAYDVVATVYSRQDPDAGIPETYIDVNLGDWDREDLERVREILKSAFGEIFDSAVYVRYNHEFPNNIE